MACPADQVRHALSHHVFTYGYEFDQPAPAQAETLGPPVPGLTYGDYHGSDLSYVFGIAAPEGAPLEGKDAELSHKVMGYWGDLARSGNPNRPPFKGAGPTWPIFERGHAVLSLQDDIAPVPEAQFRAEHHCAFWATLSFPE